MTDISDTRALVIEKFIKIEWLVNVIISQHYLGRSDKQFMLEFLYDEYCSFGLKRRVLIKISPALKGKVENDLNRLNTIRNYFAHVGIEIFSPSVPSGPGRVPDPRDHSRSVDFDELHKEFLELERPVVIALANHFQSIGGQLKLKET